MHDINAYDVTPGTAFQTDVCIIGGGAAGLSIAQALIDSEHNVLVMESGDTTADAATQSLTDIESVGNYTRRANEHGLPSRIRCLGGTTNIWGGRCGMLSPIDLAARDWVPDSGWPLEYKELAPCYDRASRLLRLPGSGIPQISRREKRLLDQGTLAPVSFSFADKPVNMKSEYADRIRQSSNIQICRNASAIEIESATNAQSIRQVHFRTLNRIQFKVRAKAFVLACGGWENARLLLLSRRSHAAGLGNQHDVVGRYLMDHPILRSGTIIQADNLIQSPVLLCPTKTTGGYTKQGFRLSDAVQRKERLLNHYVDVVPIYNEPLQHLPYARKGILKLLRSSPENIMQPAYWQQMRKGIGFVCGQFLNRRIVADRLAIINHLEQAPSRESRVSLSADTDCLGLQRLKVDLRVSSFEKESLRQSHRILREFLRQQKVGELESDLPAIDGDWSRLTDAFHHMGTTRMSVSPTTGVVDKNCRVHGIRNLFISGSSVFPTGGCVNPTLTIVALSLRLADFLKSGLDESPVTVESASTATVS